MVEPSFRMKILAIQQLCKVIVFVSKKNLKEVCELLSPSARVSKMLYEKKVITLKKKKGRERMMQ